MNTTTAKHLKSGDLFFLAGKRFRATAVARTTSGRVMVATTAASLALLDSTPVTIHSNYSA